MIVQVVAVSVTVIVWACLHYGNAIHRREHEFDTKNDPARCRARRLGIERRREILMRHRNLYQAAWEKSRDNKEKSSQNWVGLIEIDARLDKLAREEADIPLFDDIESEAAQ